jgi:polysaccharide biosynthesis/export protein
MNRITNRLAVIACLLFLALRLCAGQELQTRARYVLRSGDTLELQYRLTPDLNQIVVIQPDGYVNLNVAGDLHVGGLTVQQAHDLIISKADARLNNPELNLILKDFTHPSVTVAGEVSHPGKIELRENTSALGAVMSSGGFTGNAKSGQVLIFRKVNDSFAEVKQLDLAKIKKDKDLERDMELEPGDVVYVPRDRIATLQHYLSLTNVGMYFDPTTFFH